MSASPSSESRAGRRLVLGLLAAAAITVAVVAIMTGAFDGVGADPGSGGSSSGSTPPPVPVVDEVVADGFAMPVRTAELGSTGGGTVLEVPVVLGQVVAAGDVLVALDRTVLDADLEGARAAVDAATARAAQARALETQSVAQIAVAEANLDGASAALDRARDNKAGVAEARAARDAARAQVRVAQAAATGATEAAAAADADMTRAAAAVTALEAGVDALTIRAPFGGTVVAIPAVAGSTASPGQVLVRIADVSAWEFVTTELDESGIDRVRLGAAAAVSLDGVPGTRIEGTVARIGGYGSRRQGGIVYEVVVVPTGEVPDGVHWNMTATITIKVGE